MTGIKAIETLENLEQPSDFASSLCRQYRRRGSLSEKQWYWADKLANEAVAPKVEQAEVIGDFDRMVALFRTAKDSGLKFPKVRLEVGDSRLVLALCGAASRNPGWIRATNGAHFHSPQNRFFGFITTDGELRPGRDCTPEVVEALREFAANPEAVAKAYGQQTGSCCFCGKELTDNRSLTVGYGPICADKYALPWG